MAKRRIIDERMPSASKYANTPNLVNQVVGMRILSIPYALFEGSWCSIFIFFLVATLCLCTRILLHKCMESRPIIKTYPDTGQMAFRKKGRVITQTFVYLEPYLVDVQFLILKGNNLTKLFPNVSLNILGRTLIGKQCFVLLTTFVVLPTTWLTGLGVLAFLSAGGILSSIIIPLAIESGGVFDGVGFHQRDTLWKLHGLPTTLSLYTFAIVVIAFSRPYVIPCKGSQVSPRYPNLYICVKYIRI
ncbi:hypothetical protein OSB04_021857 [Centaurea solstitialis]|uniref:Amino acid transporter transmembrane domain-containing protein n=1 Tax=Centaurea solstitialis TaxID=347529 RepID=A0AA38SUZ6_9ASTR|nr:hypothetical protein OSB04_021857 [Centaurea solstitialis]